MLYRKMGRRQSESTRVRSSAASNVYKGQSEPLVGSVARLTEPFVGSVATEPIVGSVVTEPSVGSVVT